MESLWFFCNKLFVYYIYIRKSERKIWESLLLDILVLIILVGKKDTVHLKGCCNCIKQKPVITPLGLWWSIPLLNPIVCPTYIIFKRHKYTNFCIHTWHNFYSATGDENVIDDVRLLCHEFDSLTLIWNATTTGGGIIIIVELTPCETTEDVPLIKEVYFSKCISTREFTCIVYLRKFNLKTAQ